MLAQFEARLANQVKDEVRKEYHSCLASWSLPIRKRVIWPVKRLVRERRWHHKVEVEEVGFADQFVELDVEPTEQLEVVAKDIPNLVDVGMEISFHDQLVESDMEIAKQSIMDDPFVFWWWLACCRASCCEQGDCWCCEFGMCLWRSTYCC